ncbi:MAG: response regulator transcription factor [Chloroflexi bacterium]|nr:response regulator transcription factor [Chloroflexota bacterium]
MSSAPIRVLIAEDHAVVREGTRQILAADPGIEVVGEAEDGQQALELAGQLKPDVLVLDLRLPVVTGIEVARRIDSYAPDTRILVLSAYDDDDYVFAAMDAGAAGYLLKTAHGEEVVSAIHSISRGEVVLQAAVASKFLRSHGNARPGADYYEEKLTEREMEILRLAALGLRNKEIASRLNLSQRTVEGHLSHTFAKFNVGSRTEAILHAAARGWLVIPNTS